MKSFILGNTPRTYFGKDALKQAIEKEKENMGQKILIAYGGNSIKENNIFNSVKDSLEAIGKEVYEFSGIMSNPTYDKVQEGADFVRKEGIDFIFAVGGGSVIDCCKMISAQAKAKKDIWEMEFIEGAFPTDFIPMASIVTASGTGAEMNSGAVITNEEKKIKTGMLGALSEFVVLDLSYTLTVPMNQVISGAFDTLSHCMETYFGKPLENNVSDEINESIMRNVIRNIKEVIKDLKSIEVRSELMWDSSIAEVGWLKLGKTTDFQCHQLEHQLGAYTNCNHGQGLAVIHPKVYRHIYKEGLSKFVRFAKEVWHVDTENKTEEEIAVAGIKALEDFIKEINPPTTLTELNITDIDMLKEVANSTNITPGCCKQMTHEEIFEILKECI